LRAIALLVLLTVAFAVCGDLICESSEIGNCRDCALINQNYVCDSFPDALPQFDPDCNNTGNCYGPEPRLYTYSNGRGKNCFPGYCSGGTCETSCSSNSQCTSGFCVEGTCRSTFCNGEDCLIDSASLSIRPVMTGIYLGRPTYVMFALTSDTSSTVEVVARGPCELEYDRNVTLIKSGERYVGYITVVIDNCRFTGIGSVMLSAPAHGANATIHFLSYPARLYSYGEVERSSGEARIASTLNGIPVEVVVWAS